MITNKLTYTELQFTLKYSMNQINTYGQTFSKGQLTIPKKFRDYFNLGDNFAYKMTNQGQKIIIEPQSQKKESLSSIISQIDQPVFTDKDYKDYLKMRKENKKREATLGYYKN